MITIFITQKNLEMLKNISANAVKSNFDAVVSVGGDGTLNECAKSLKTATHL